ncbi:hypothetical protein WJX84_002509 [Apatococcus fuscideae]|uniref:Rab GDP dissociation inhibitor n=1 Tax=Apatococcus fuscideae TaxID=2026836 RepID=A0AAW1SQW7_9CHLO
MPEIPPSHFNLVILGTGLQAALLAGRAALAGKTVLHLDQADHYGAAWSTLSWQQMQQLHALPEAGSLLNVSSGTAAHADLGRLSSYAFDLAPRVLYCAGPAIEALVTTGAHHYLEFKLISGNYFWNGRRLQSVPAGRSDVFQDRSLSLTSKRMLMRFLKNLQDAMEGRGPLKDAFDDRPFVTLLEQQGLDEQLRHVLLHAIALDPWSSKSAESAASSAGMMTAARGQRALAQHAASMGRFGPGSGAFLTPLYGGSEMSQAFCRVAAVHGALYVLRQPIAALLMDSGAAAENNSCRGVRLDTGQEITCSALAADPLYLHDFRVREASASSAAVSRAICVLDRPLQVGGQQALMTFPPGSFPGSCQHAIHALQLSPACALTPPNRYLLQLSAPASNVHSAASDFLPLLDALLEVPAEK